jgi:ubiquinone biosynthesis protein
VTSTLHHLFRLGGVGLVCAREGIFGLVDPAPLPPQLRLVRRLGRLIERPSAVDAKHRLSTAVTTLGPTYVKLGQFLATRPDVVGPALARDLKGLQDSMSPFPQAEAEKTVAAAFDKKLSDVFVTFGPPVAAASIAQVHRAEIETPSGRRAVAAKVLRPGIERRFKVDLEAFGFVARRAELLSAEARRLRSKWSKPLPVRSRLRWTCGSRRRRFQRWRRTARTIQISGCRGWNGTIRPAMC